jgi:hypothetical protein
MNSKTRIVVYFDVDDTLVRSAGTKIIPVSSMVAHARSLASSGAELYCWSAAGADYARSTAQRVGIEQCFVGFLPKPSCRRELSAWRQLTVVHPLNVTGKSVEEYRNLLDEE